MFYDALEPRRSRRDQLVIQAWHGFPIEASGVLRKGSTFKENVSHVSNVIENVDFILSYSKMFNLLFNACFPSKSSKYALTGMPRNDFLFRPKEEALTKFKKLTGFDFKDKKIILFCPSKKISKESVLDIVENILKAKLLERTNSALLIKSDGILEDLFSSNGDNRISFLNEKILRENMTDVYECLAAVDVLVTDQSSMAYDWLLTDKPIVYYIPSYEKIENPLVEPLEDWLPGEIVFDVKGLIVNLERFLMESFIPDDKYIWLKGMVHHFQDGNSCERVIEFLHQYYEKGSE